MSLDSNVFLIIYLTAKISGKSQLPGDTHYLFKSWPDKLHR